MEIKKIHKNKFIFLTGVYIFAYLFVPVGVVSAATLQINSNSSTISAGDTVILYVNVNSEGIAINNADATIEFPTDLFDIVSVSKSGSIFSLWVEEPTFSNTSGEITFNGGIPTPGFNGSSGSVISISARAKKSGQGEFTFSGAAVRANDGLGTDVLNSQQGKIISIIKKDETPAPVPAQVAEPVSQIPGLQIISESHPNQDVWYNNSNPVFSWNLPSGVDAVRTGISDVSTDVPTVSYSPAINKKSVNDLGEGVWYFKVRPRKNGSWGPVSVFAVRVDTVAPVNNKTDFYYDVSSKTININADVSDVTSGVDHYDIYINNDIVKTIPTSMFVGGQYKIDYEKKGSGTIKLSVFDKAGNSTSINGVFVVPEPQIETNNKNQLINNVSKGIVPLAVFVLLVMLWYLIKPLYQAFVHRQKMKEAISTGNHSKALTLLKKRLEKHLELLQKTRHERILTKEEKIIKEGIESDLDEIDKALGKN